MSSNTAKTTPVVTDEIVIFQKKKTKDDSSTDSIDLNDETPKKQKPAEDDEGYSDLGLYDNVCVNLQNSKRITGVLCLFKKRNQLFISYLPIDVRNTVTFKTLITKDTGTVDIQSYKINIPFREIVAFYVKPEKSSMLLSFEVQQNRFPMKIPIFEFCGKKELFDSFMTTMKNNSNSTITKDETRKTRYIVTHKFEMRTDAALFHKKAYLRLTNPSLVQKRKSLMVKEHVDVMAPITRKFLQSLMDERGFITASNMNTIRKVLLYRGCENEVREFVWKLCLGFYEGKNTQKERMEWDEQRKEDYEKIKSTWTNVLPEMKENWDEFVKTEDQIMKDVKRTDRDDPMFKADDSFGLKLLTNVLMSATMFNMKIMYGQGMKVFSSNSVYLNKQLNKLEQLYTCY
ncbi:TBC/Rab gtpase activating domain containing protein, partial [Entamoeba invadens IP1]